MVDTRHTRTRRQAILHQFDHPLPPSPLPFTFSVNQLRNSAHADVGRVGAVSGARSSSYNVPKSSKSQTHLRSGFASAWLQGTQCFECTHTFEPDVFICLTFGRALTFVFAVCVITSAKMLLSNIILIKILFDVQQVSCC